MSRHDEIVARVARGACLRALAVELEAAAMRLDETADNEVRRRVLLELVAELRARAVAL